MLFEHAFYMVDQEPKRLPGRAVLVALPQLGGVRERVSLVVVVDRHGGAARRVI